MGAENFTETACSHYARAALNSRRHENCTGLDVCSHIRAVILARFVWRSCAASIFKADSYISRDGCLIHSIPTRKSIRYDVNIALCISCLMRSAREWSPLLRKFLDLSIRQNLVMTRAYDRTLTVQTLGEGMAVRSHLVGGECVIAEVKFWNLELVFKNASISFKRGLY